MENVDLLRNNIKAREGISDVEGVQLFIPPKTGEDRTVTIPSSLAKLLSEYLSPPFVAT